MRRLGRGWVALIAAGAVYTVIVCVVVAIRAESTSDFRDFWRTAVVFRQSGQISSELGVHNYLPVFTILMTPWSVLPLRVAIVLFTLLSLGLLAWTLVLVERLLCGRLPERPRAVMLAVVGLMLAYVTSCAVVGQLGLVLCWLVVFALWRARRGHQRSAGVALGLAALLKLLPGVLIVYFLLRGRWRLVAVAGAFVVVVGVGLPLALLGPGETLRQHQAYYERAVRGHAAYTTIHAEKPIKANYSNNALPIVLRRLMSPVVASKQHGQGVEWRVNLINAAPGTIWACYVGLMVCLVGVSLLVGLRGRDEAGGYACWCCLMLLASPLVWTHYLPLAYWPLAWLVDRGARIHDLRGRPWWPAVVAVVVWLVGLVLLAWPAVRAAGAQIVPVIVLWAVVSWLGLRHSGGQFVAGETPDPP